MIPKIILEFPYRLATNRSFSKRKKLYGIGVNDAPYVVKPTANGKMFECHYYRAWKDMFTRSYSKSYHEREPTYKNVSVCKEWHSFMSFKKWMEDRDWLGLQLDKDLMVIGNKEYRPDRCMFVSHEINSLYGISQANRSLPIGVTFCKQTGKYRARDPENNAPGKRYSNPIEAHIGWKKAKIRKIHNVLEYQQDLLIKNSLLSLATHIENLPPFGVFD